MAKPAFIFDGRNVVDHRKLHEIGFNVYPIGKPALTHLREGGWYQVDREQENITL